MFATEAFRTWGPGPAVSAPTGWDKVVAHPTIIAAFFGFLGGVVIKSLIDLALDWHGRKRQKRLMAAELHSELRWIWEALRRVERMTIEQRDRTTGKTVVIYRNEWQRKRGPKMPVFEAQIGQLGLLDVEISAGLIKLNGGISSWNQQVDAILEDMSDGQLTLPRDVCNLWIDLLHSILQDAANLNRPLAKAAGTAAHDWQVVENQIWRPPAQAA